MKVFVVIADAVEDVDGFIIANAALAGVYDSLEKANRYINEVEETWLRKRFDYTIEEATVE